MSKRAALEATKWTMAMVGMTVLCCGFLALATYVSMLGYFVAVMGVYCTAAFGAYWWFIYRQAKRDEKRSSR